MLEELKPCWCCGHKMFVGKHKYVHGKYIVRCGSDGTNCTWFPSSGAIEKADLARYIAIWNARKTKKSNTHYQKLFDKSMKLNTILAEENSKLKAPWIEITPLTMPEEPTTEDGYQIYTLDSNERVGTMWILPCCNWQESFAVMGYTHYMLPPYPPEKDNDE